MKKLRIFLLILIVIGVVIIVANKEQVPKTSTLNNSTETPKAVTIVVDTPQPGETITSPLTIKGDARGNWFFEGSFPITLVNWDGVIVAEGIATAKDNWMTTDFVPFETTLTFTSNTKAYSNKGTLVLRKDNPSGLGENDEVLEIPIIFAD